MLSYIHVQYIFSINTKFDNDYDFCMFHCKTMGSRVPYKTIDTELNKYN